jgi:uncharacterized protein
MKFVHYCQFVADEEKIAEHSSQHHHYMADLRKMGKVVAAGPFADKTGALFVFDVIDRSDLEAIIADDPFTKGGVFAHCEIKELVFV